MSSDVVTEAGGGWWILVLSCPTRDPRTEPSRKICQRQIADENENERVRQRLRGQSPRPRSASWLMGFF